MNENNSYEKILKENGIIISEFIYPIYKKSTSSGIVVKFDSETTGDVIYPDIKKNLSRYGWIIHTECNWIDLTDEEYRQHVSKEGMFCK